MMSVVSSMNLVCYSHKHLLFSCYLIILGRSEVANEAQYSFVCAFQGTIQYNKKFGAHSHLPENGLYSLFVH